MMKRVRQNKVGEAIKKELSQLLQQGLKDPRVGFITVTAVEMSGDLQQATVYVTVLGDETERDNTMAALDKAKGYLRSEIGRRIHLRHTPELIFIFDESIEYGNRIERLLRDIKEDKEIEE